jgi:hypothetical protein
MAPRNGTFAPRHAGAEHPKAHEPAMAFVRHPAAGDPLERDGSRPSQFAQDARLEVVDPVRHCG